MKLEIIQFREINQSSLKKQLVHWRKVRRSWNIYTYMMQKKEKKKTAVKLQYDSYPGRYPTYLPRRDYKATLTAEALQRQNPP